MDNLYQIVKGGRLWDNNVGADALLGYHCTSRAGNPREPDNTGTYA